MNFTRAIVRPPSQSFTAGLSNAALGPPDVARAVKQHAAYVETLRDCGLDVTHLSPDEAHPDGTFVEDTAIVTGRGAILTRPGAPSRQGEVRSIAECLRRFYAEQCSIEAPGTVHRHVQRHHGDRMALREPLGQVCRGVGDDGDAHERRAYGPHSSEGLNATDEMRAAIALPTNSCPSKPQCIPSGFPAPDRTWSTSPTSATAIT